MGAGFGMAIRSPDVGRFELRKPYHAGAAVPAQNLQPVSARPFLPPDSARKAGSIRGGGHASTPVDHRVRRLEHHDGAGHLASLHGAEELVHVLELAAAGDHLVQLEAALPVQLDVARHVHLEAVGAHAAALDLLFAEEHGAVELDLLPDGNHAHHGGGPPGAYAVEALLGGDLEADGLEGVVHAAVRQITNGFH